MFTFYILFTSFYLMALAVLAIGLLKKKNLSKLFIKVMVLMVIIFFVNFYNVGHIPNQFARHSLGGRQRLLEPKNENIEKLKVQFYAWYLDTYNESFDSLSDNDEGELEIKLARLDDYVLTEIFEYTSDGEAPYYTSDYVATIDEIFKSDTDHDGLLQDDCDGISLVTASLLLNLGYNTFIAECLSHWNSIVFPKGADPKTLEGFEKGIHLYNWWERPSYYIFNETEVIIPPGRPIALTLFELYTDASVYEYDYLMFFYGGYIDLPLFLLLIIGYGILYLVSLLLYYITKLGLLEGEGIRIKKLKWFFSKHAFKTSLKVSLIGIFAAIVLFWFAISGLGFFGNLILCGTIVVCFKFAEREITRANQSYKPNSGRE